MHKKRKYSSGLFLSHINHLRSPLQPLLSITSGVAHPDFPATLFHYHLLSEAQLDDLAHFYHQRTPTIFSWLYPEPIVGRWWIHSDDGSSSGSGNSDERGQQSVNLAGSCVRGEAKVAAGTSASIEEKRRRFGRFVGLRGCESPTFEGTTVWTEEELERWVRQRIEVGMLRQREKELAQSKGF
jgi:hypothetical protein